MKKLLYIIVIVLAGQGLKAQQLPMYSQYYLNKYAINPAVGGSKSYYDVRSTHRYQWIGITDAPRTYTLSIHGPTKDRKMGLGGYLFTDHVGPTRRTGIQFSYSYHLDLTEDMRLSMGLSAGLLQFLIDGSKITLRDPGDAVLSNGVQSALMPDFKFGLYLYGSKYFFGVSAPQIAHNKIFFFENQEESNSFLEDHYYAMGGYLFDINEDIQIEPGFLVKYANPAPVQLDLLARVIYQDKIWLGGSFRTNDAISIMGGYVYRESLTIGYAYDMTTTNIRNYSSGTHELMLGVRFVRAKTISAPSFGE